MLSDPFETVSPVLVTGANSASVITNYRVKPVTAAVGKRILTVEECRSIALSNSLELQAARIEELTKQAVAYSNQTKMLPHFLFTGDLSNRDNIPMSFSQVWGKSLIFPPSNAYDNAQGGTGVTQWARSHERSTWRYSVEARWSPMDAALAYYVTKSSRNEQEKAHYQKVRTAQKLIATVDSAFYRLLALQECFHQANELCGLRSSIAQRMKKLFQTKMANVDDFNRAEQQAVRARRVLTRTGTELQKQINILASAMGLSPDQCVDGGLEVVGDLTPPNLDQPVCQLEMVAAQNRPEAIQAGLNHLNSINDWKRTVVKYSPRVAGFWRYTYDKDEFQFNKDWHDIGVNLYFDLLDWFSNVDESRAARLNREKTQKEMGAVALGIATQVRLAALNYDDARNELSSSEQALRSSSEVARVAATRTAKDDLDRISLDNVNADVLQDKLDRTKTLGEIHASLAELNGAVGTNYNEPYSQK